MPLFPRFLIFYKHPHSHLDLLVCNLPLHILSLIHISEPTRQAEKEVAAEQKTVEVTEEISTNEYEENTDSTTSDKYGAVDYIQEDPDDCGDACKI